MEEVKFIKVSPDEDLKSLLKKLDSSNIKILFCCDSHDKYIGTITDGDIRRSLLEYEIDQLNADLICNKNSLSCSEQDISSAIYEAKKAQYKYIPIIKDGSIVKVVSIAKNITANNPPVVLMAGGLGVRLGSITKEKPKPLVEISKNLSIIDLILANLISSGFKEVHITLNHMAEKIQKHLENKYTEHLKINFVIENSKMGTAGSLYYLKEYLDGDFILMNCDIVTTLNFSSLLEFHKKNQNLISVVANKTSHQISKGVIKYTNSTITEIEEKPTINYTYNAGIYVVNNQCIKRLKEEYLDMPDLIKEYIPTKKVGLFPLIEYWKDLGIPEDLEDVRNYLSNSRSDE